MTCSLPPKDAFDYLIAITPIIITGFVAIVVFWQYRVNRDKLRLDLYNRRFDIYSKTLDFYQALLVYNPSSKEQFEVLQKAFIKAYRESQFLFDNKSGIYDILDQMHSKSFEICAIKDHGKEISDADPREFLKMHEKSIEALKYCSESMPKLEKAMACYLNFHKITA